MGHRGILASRSRALEDARISWPPFSGPSPFWRPGPEGCGTRLQQPGPLPRLPCGALAAAHGHPLRPPLAVLQGPMHAVHRLGIVPNRGPLLCIGDVGLPCLGPCNHGSVLGKMLYSSHSRGYRASVALLLSTNRSHKCDKFIKMCVEISEPSKKDRDDRTQDALPEIGMPAIKALRPDLQIGPSIHRSACTTDFCATTPAAPGWYGAQASVEDKGPFISPPCPCREL